MDIIVPIENGAEYIQTQSEQSLTDYHFEDIFQTNTHDCTDIYSELPPLNERKQALERQLQTRRDQETLQSHGILPPPNTPSHYYLESKHLERARTENFLKKKIGQRPDKKTLIEYHILEETNVSPLIIEPQKKLQKAQLANRLSEKISGRPGPLELIEKGIIEPGNLQLQNAIRNGKVYYEPVDSVFSIANSVNYVLSPPEGSPITNSPPLIENRSVAELKADFECKLRPQTPPRPLSRADTISSRRSNSNLRIKKLKNRSKFKFHVYEPTKDKRKENYNNGNNKNVMQNYENRMKQQQTLLHEMDKLQSHIERSLPQREKYQVKNLHCFRLPTECKAEPVMIAPSPVPTGDKMMVDIEQRALRPVCRVEKLVKKFENAQHDFTVPSPLSFKEPPTPPPVDRLDSPVLKFEPERISEYKVKELKAILRENNLTVSGTKEALIERLMRHHRNDTPKPKPGKLKVKFDNQEVNLGKIREEMEQMRKIINEKDQIIGRLTGSIASSDMASSTETITSDTSNLTNNDQRHMFGCQSFQQPLVDKSQVSQVDRRLFPAPSAPALMENGLDELMDFNYQSVQSSKYSDEDSGVNSQENLSDVMERDNSLDWLALESDLSMDCAQPFDDSLLKDFFA